MWRCKARWQGSPQREGDARGRRRGRGNGKPQWRDGGKEGDTVAAAAAAKGCAVVSKTLSPETGRGFYLLKGGMTGLRDDRTTGLRDDGKELKG
jgi:hypothetical protein